MAECCKPIPGDSVVGYKDPASHRIIVHKSNCKELDRLAAQFGRNILKDEIKWSQHKAMSYLSTIELRGIDRTGILLDLAKTVSEDFQHQYPADQYPDARQHFRGHDQPLCQGCGGPACNHGQNPQDKGHRHRKT